MILHLKKIPYYSKFSGNSLHDYPLLTKQTIRDNFPDLMATEGIEVAKWNTSGGSTGEPVKLLQTPLYNMHVGYALKYYFEEIVGLDLRPLRKLIIWGSEKDLLTWTGDWRKKVKGWVRGTKYINSFSIDAHSVGTIAEEINNYQPEFIQGYVSSLELIARLVKQKGLTINPPLVVNTRAETVLPEQRAIIEEVFKAPLFDIYGSRECGMIAGQCKRGNYHTMSFNHHVEVINDDGEKTGKDETGKVLASTLHNFAMPLIRYEIGDLAIPGDGKCSCENPLPILKQIVGRVTDNFCTADGRVVHGEFFTHLLYFKDWVQRFRFVQEDFDLVNLLIELREGNFDQDAIEKDMKQITRDIRTVMGDGCKLQIIMGKIPPIGEGKHIYTISKVKGFS